MAAASGIRASFWGVRGSTPCEGPQFARYGGHSSCVTLEPDGHPPIVLDLGTGLTPYGDHWMCKEPARPFRGTVLLTHNADYARGMGRSGAERSRGCSSACGRSAPACRALRGDGLGQRGGGCGVA